MKHRRFIFGGLGLESATFSTIIASTDDFAKVTGEECLSPNLASQLEERKIDLVPTSLAWAVPAGKASFDAYSKLSSELLNSIEEAGECDAIILRLHGSMEVDGIGSGEIALLKSIRERFGTDLPIGCALDLHANLAPEFIDYCDVVSAYRTAPHRDLDETILRVVDGILLALDEGFSPKRTLIKLPLLLPGEKAVTETEPARSLYAGLSRYDQNPNILDSSLVVGFAWSDVPNAGASVLVTARTQAAADNAARELAEQFWSKRKEFAFHVPVGEIDYCIKEAQRRKETVFISDSGDNPTAGAPGDNPLCLKHLLMHRVENALLAQLCDEEAVTRCMTHPTNGTLELELGKKLDRRFGSPLTVTAQVLRKEESSAANQYAVIQVEGVTVILTTKREPFVSVEQFKTLGLELLDFDIVIVKLGYLYPELYDLAPYAMMALTPGASNERIEELPFEHVPRPIFPLDHDINWSPS